MTTENERAMETNLIPHINLSSYPGGGKTTLTKILLSEHKAVLIPKFTTRPERPNEEIPEYIFISPEEFEARRQRGDFIAVEAISRYGVTHHHAIPKIEHWPKIPEGTELIVSVFGIEAQQAKEFVPSIRLCFIDFHDKEILKTRLRERCKIDNSDFASKLETIERYVQERLHEKYESIIYNDGTTQESIGQILRILQDEGVHA